MNDKLLDGAELAEMARAMLRDGSRFLEILDQVSFGVLVVDVASHAVLYVNRFAQDLSGYRAEELIGYECYKLVRPARRGKCPITDMDERVFHSECFLVTASAAEVPILKTVVVVNLGGRDCLVEVFQDLGELVRTRVVLEQERDRAQSYLDLVEVMVLALDRKGRILMLNRHGAELLGHSVEELVGMDWFEFVPLEHREAARQVFKALVGGKLKLNEFHENPVLNARGQERLIAWRNTILQDSEGQVVGILGAGQDITLRRQTEHELDKRMAEMIQFNSMAVDRELRMIELKSEVNDLLTELGRDAKYEIVE